MSHRFYLASWEDSDGVYALDYDFEKKTPLSLKRECAVDSTSYFARRDDVLYALSENQGPGDFAGTVTSFRMGPEGLKKLDVLEGVPTGSPHISLSKDGKQLYAASYNNGKVCSADVSDGTFGPVTSMLQQTGSSVRPDRQEGPHAHIMCPSPDGRYVVCCDLGTDTLNIYDVSGENGALVPFSRAKAPAGYGPRHAVFSEDGSFLYVVCELQYHLLTFRFEEGQAELIDDRKVIESLPEDKNWGGAIKFGPGGLLYTTNRPEGMSTLDLFSLQNPELPELLKSLYAGEHIRDFAFFSEDGKDYLLALSMTGNLVRVYEFDREALSLTLLSEIPGIRKPVCIEAE